MWVFTGVVEFLGSGELVGGAPRREGGVRGVTLGRAATTVQGTHVVVRSQVLDKKKTKNR